jgi:predicted heme/steroid binding protein
VVLCIWLVLSSHPAQNFFNMKISVTSHCSKKVVVWLDRKYNLSQEYDLIAWPNHKINPLNVYDLSRTIIWYRGHKNFIFIFYPVIIYDLSRTFIWYQEHRSYLTHSSFKHYRGHLYDIENRKALLVKR